MYSFLRAAIFFLILTGSSQAPCSSSQLLLAIDLIRHGDRTPLHEIPTSPHTWKLGLGTLTAAGAAQEFKLGRHLRGLYIDRYHLLSDQCRSASIHVRTTDRNRTIMSAAALLRGLYPQNKRCSDLPFETVSREKDTLLSVKSGGNIFQRIYDNIYLSAMA